MYNKQQGRWGSKQILNWIENNIENGRSETHNMESVIDHDLNSKYKTINEDYRQKILKKFGSKAEGTAPVYLGGGLKGSGHFLLPKIRSEKYVELRNRFGNVLDLLD